MTLTFRRISKLCVSSFRKPVCGSRIFLRRHYTNKSAPWAKHRLIGDEMTSVALTEKADTRQPAYARFSRRLRAVFIDWIIFVVVVLGALFIAVAIESDRVSRGLGVVVAVVLLLYE